jgi:hypothetical protein
VICFELMSVCETALPGMLNHFLPRATVLLDLEDLYSCQEMATAALFIVRK